MTLDVKSRVIARPSLGALTYSNSSAYKTASTEYSDLFLLFKGMVSSHGNAITASVSRQNDFVCPLPYLSSFRKKTKGFFCRKKSFAPEWSASLFLDTQSEVLPGAPSASFFRIRKLRL